MINKYTIRRIPLDKGGYANHGRKYYGVGAPVYCAEHKETGEQVEFRAADRFQARVKLKSILEGKEENYRFHAIVQKCEVCKNPKVECQCQIYSDEIFPLGH